MTINNDVEACKSTLAELKKAFPNEDTRAHHDYHTEVIKAAELRAEILKEVLKKLASGTSWAALALIGLAVWEYVKGHIQ